MALSLENAPKLTWKVPLHGGQLRLREAILYVAQKCEAAPSFGLIKLNKILWCADFHSFAERGQPVTGRQYQRLPQGPAPIEMVPVLNEMLREGLLRVERARVIDFDERRPVALVAPTLTLFSKADLDQIDLAIEFYWHWTAKEASDHSHGVAWRTRADGDAMPYELAYLSDEPLSASMRDKLLAKAGIKGLQTR